MSARRCAHLHTPTHKRTDAFHLRFAGKLPIFAFCATQGLYLKKNPPNVNAKHCITPKACISLREMTGFALIASTRSVVYHQCKDCISLREMTGCALIASSRRKCTITRDAYRLRYLASLVVFSRRIANIHANA